MPKEINREKALTALLGSTSLNQAVAQSGLSEKTMRRYLSEPEFAREYRAAKSQIFEQSICNLQIAVTQAVETLKKNLACNIPAVEVRAAQIILDTAFKGTELVELTTRVEAIEAVVKKQN